MKVSEIRKQSEKDLKKTLSEKKDKLREFRFDLVSGKVKDIRAIRATKKEIARILTILVEETKEEVK